jgi:basic membrane protein A and related proteins
VKKLFPILMVMLILIAGCAQGEQATKKDELTIGIVLSDSGLGDGSFNDSAFRGLEKARDELGILFDYKEQPDGNYEQTLNELVAEGYDLIIGLGFSIQEALEKVAKEHPEQQFLLIDGYSELKNVMSITFKEQEASFLIGMIAAMQSKTNTLGFIGGADVPVIHHFELGFIQGAQYIDPDIEVMVEYANNFGDAQLGQAIAQKQIESGADFLYPAAGFTGIGALEEAQRQHIYAAGVDSDQFFIAEKAIVTSMLKNIDVAVYEVAKRLKENGEVDGTHLELGLKENGVGLAPIRVIDLSEDQLQQIEKAKQKIVSGEITVQSEK